TDIVEPAVERMKVGPHAQGAHARDVAKTLEAADEAVEGDERAAASVGESGVEVRNARRTRGASAPGTWASASRGTPACPPCSPRSRRPRVPGLSASRGAPPSIRGDTTRSSAWRRARTGAR